MPCQFRTIFPDIKYVASFFNFCAVKKINRSYVRLACCIDSCLIIWLLMNVVLFSSKKLYVQVYCVNLIITAFMYVRFKENLSWLECLARHTSLTYFDMSCYTLLLYYGCLHFISKLLLFFSKFGASFEILAWLWILHERLFK